MVLYSIETRAKPKQVWGLYDIQRPPNRCVTGPFILGRCVFFCPLTALFYYFCASFCPSPAEGLRRHQQLIYNPPPPDALPATTSYPLERFNVHTANGYGKTHPKNMSAPRPRNVVQATGRGLPEPANPMWVTVPVSAHQHGHAPTAINRRLVRQTAALLFETCAFMGDS